jgi:4-amino-4-deoxy-L-arabinose transferase-like glycosyltransferase
MALTIALLPPTDWDGLFYHLTGPKIHLAAGRIAPGIDIPHLNFPSLMEMLFMLGMAVRGDITAKLLHFGFSLLLAALVYLTAKRHLGLKNGWPAVLFLFSMPMVLTLSGWAYNDLALAFYQMAALYALLNWSIPPNPSTPDQDTGDQRSAVNGRRWLALSGVFCGLTMSLKYTAVVAPVALAGLLLWRLRRSKTPLKGALTSVLAFALPALIVSGPWYLKNWFFTGNPVYPFVFEGLFWDEFRSAAYAGSGSGIGFDPALLLGLPYQLTLGLRDANYIDGRTGPLFLAFLPLLLLYGLLRYRRKAMPPALNGLLIFALAQFAFWTVGAIWSTGLWQSRLLLPGLIPLCPALAWMIRDIRHLNHPQFSLQRFLMLFIGVVLMLGLVDQLFNNQIKSRSGWLYYRPLTHLIGTETRSTYLTRRLGVHYAAMEQLNEELPPTAVVTFLWEPRSYYCRLDCRPDSILDKYGHLQYLHGQDAAAIAQAWREEGVTHVLIFKLGLDFLLNEEGLSAEIRPDPTVLNQLKATDFDLVLDAHNAYQVYRLK